MKWETATNGNVHIVHDPVSRSSESHLSADDIILSNNSMEEQIDKVLFDEIKAAQEDGIVSADVAEQMELPIEKVNTIFTCEKFKDYVELHGSVKQKENHNKITPAQAGYYKGLVAKKQEQNKGLKDTEKALAANVKYLWQVISFLENRKAELENGIRLLEKNLLTGARALEIKEDN